MQIENGKYYEAKNGRKEDTIVQTGGPTAYYDIFPNNLTTLNDWLEHMSVLRWGEYSLHFKDLMKGAARWGSKEGTTKEYDLKKIIYSGCRIMIMLVGKDKTREYLQELLEAEQFGGKPNVY